MMAINNNGKNDNINLSNENDGNNEMSTNKNSNMIIIVKKPKVLKINKIVKSVCFP